MTVRRASTGVLYTTAAAGAANLVFGAFGSEGDV